MTSGPMPINALPPERTPDPQPDPQVVTWMQAHRSTLDPRMHPSDARVETVRAYRNAHREESLRHGLRALVDAYNEAARKPATVADIPAGQGAASLFLGSFEIRGLSALYFKAHDGRIARVMEEPRIRTEERALWEHLAATLPTVTD